jgi:hypothetical protein
MSKFKHGDRVKVVKPFTNADFPEGYTEWIPEMDETVGMYGVVDFGYDGDHYGDDGAIAVDLDNGDSFAYHEKSLEFIA